MTVAIISPCSASGDDPMPNTLTASDIERLLDNAPSYRSKVLVEAIPVTQDGEWTTTAGNVLRTHAGDWWVVDGNDRWSVAAHIFEMTYVPVGDGKYRKSAPVKAIPMRQAFVVRTLEGEATGRPGDWLVRNASGESWPSPADTFKQRYARISI